MMVTIIVALISAAALVITALIGRGILDRRIGRPNGRGNVIEMNEEQLDVLEAIQKDATTQRTKIEDDLRAYRSDSAQQMRLLRSMVGNLKIDAQQLDEFRREMHELQDRIAYLEAFAENCKLPKGNTFKIPKTRLHGVPTDITD